MFTFFTIPKPHKGQIQQIQRNAVMSWRASCAGAQIVLFGEDEGVHAFAEDCKVSHVRQLKRNDFGTPLLSDAFAQIFKTASYPIIVYANCDIVFTTAFANTVMSLATRLKLNFIASGRRTDIDSIGNLDFSDPLWETGILAKIQKSGILHGWSGIDYLIFPNTCNFSLPPFPVGRPGWDTWLLFNCKQKGIPVIDMTHAVTAIHQNHNPAYSQIGQEAIRNITIAGGYENFSSLREADFVFYANRLHRPNLLRWAFAFMSRLPLIRFFLGIKRRLQRSN